jgi:hypothetical protein
MVIPLERALREEVPFERALREEVPLERVLREKVPIYFMYIFTKTIIHSKIIELNIKKNFLSLLYKLNATKHV